MMILGLLGMPRRQSSYPDGYGWGFWNAMATFGAFMIAASILVFMWNVIRSLRHGEIAGEDPWDGRTLEWTIPSPPPHYNFAEIPQVHALDDFWHRKYTEDEQGRAIPVPAIASDHAASNDHDAGHDDGHGIHMPSPSVMPLIAALGFPILGFGMIYSAALVPVGAAVLVVGVYLWILEPATEA
jgi:cytochrome c oxidase subunit 1